MPDISMCMNHTCPSASKCYRHEAMPNAFWQSYADFKPDESGKCDSFLGHTEKQRFTVTIGEKNATRIVISCEAENSMQAFEDNLHLVLEGERMEVRAG